MKYLYVPPEKKEIVRITAIKTIGHAGKYLMEKKSFPPTALMFDYKWEPEDSPGLFLLRFDNEDMKFASIIALRIAAQLTGAFAVMILADVFMRKLELTEKESEELSMMQRRELLEKRAIEGKRSSECSDRTESIIGEIIFADGTSEVYHQNYEREGEAIRLGEIKKHPGEADSIFHKIFEPSEEEGEEKWM